jgi:hypothetical protein
MNQYLGVKREWPSSVRLAMWFSLVAMAFPNTGLMLAALWGISTGGQGLGVFLAAELFILPIFGLIGWFAGRFIAWASKDRIQGEQRRSC